MEQYKQISEDKYITSTGCIYNARTDRFLKDWDNGNGYRYYRVRDGESSQGVHRLVALAFIPNPNNYLTVNHIDGDKTNNNVENLEWCTQSYNGYHRQTMIDKKNPKKYSFIDKSGEIYYVSNLRKFSEEVDIPYSTLLSLVANKDRVTRTGWSYFKE